MTDYDERAWELELARCDDGDILLSQGFDGNGDEMTVRLHRCHLDLLASMTGYLSENVVARTCERLKDRLHLLAGMVEAHTRQGDPLRAAVAAIVPEYVSLSAMQRNPPVRPDSVPLMPSAAIPPAPPSMDLFSDIADEVQNDD
jgi:hypothetical protein